MLDVELRKLRKSELLELLLEVEEENEQLASENRQLKEQLASKELTISNCGSIAEASLQLSGVLVAAQKAADMYLHNVRNAANEQQLERGEFLTKTRDLCLSYAREVERLCAATLSASATAGGENAEERSTAEPDVMAASHALAAPRTAARGVGSAVEAAAPAATVTAEPAGGADALSATYATAAGHAAPAVLAAEPTASEADPNEPAAAPAATQPEHPASLQAQVRALFDEQATGEGADS